MNSLTSLALFVGAGKCNANCRHCAGKIHRKNMPKLDGIIDEELVSRTLRECYMRGARQLSISSGGEPTLSPVSVTKALRLADECRQEGMAYSPISIYSNGIRIGMDKKFCSEYLGLWKSLGLARIYVTVHDTDEKKNAEFYGIKEYPLLETVISRIHEAGLLMRANMVLSKNNIGTYEMFVSIVERLKAINADMISAWPVRGADDKLDLEACPPESEMNRIRQWAKDKKCYNIIILGDKERIVYETGQKLTLFPGGKLSNTWCNN